MDLVKPLVNDFQTAKQVKIQDLRLGALYRFLQVRAGKALLVSLARSFISFPFVHEIYFTCALN